MEEFITETEPHYRLLLGVCALAFVLIGIPYLALIYLDFSAFLVIPVMTIVAAVSCLLLFLFWAINRIVIKGHTSVKGGQVIVKNTLSSKLLLRCPFDEVSSVCVGRMPAEAYQNEKLPSSDARVAVDLLVCNRNRVLSEFGFLRVELFRLHHDEEHIFAEVNGATREYPRSKHTYLSLAQSLTNKLRGKIGVKCVECYK